ncbi:MAG: hypothetical protein NXI18_19795 [Alphaproteobacteria bacterium]|nr:hypothetical protein [Alphaproteobacteria bacterium]
MPSATETAIDRQAALVRVRKSRIIADAVPSISAMSFVISRIAAADPPACDCILAI